MRTNHRTFAKCLCGALAITAICSGCANDSALVAERAQASSQMPSAQRDGSITAEQPSPATDGGPDVTQGTTTVSENQQQLSPSANLSIDDVELGTEFDNETDANAARQLLASLDTETRNGRVVVQRSAGQSDSSGTEQGARWVVVNAADAVPGDRVANSDLEFMWAQDVPVFETGGTLDSRGGFVPGDSDGIVFDRFAPVSPEILADLMSLNDSDGIASFSAADRLNNGFFYQIDGVRSERPFDESLQQYMMPRPGIDSVNFVTIKVSTTPTQFDLNSIGGLGFGEREFTSEQELSDAFSEAASSHADWQTNFNAALWARFGGVSSQDQLIQFFNEYIAENPHPAGQVFLHDLSRPLQPDGSMLPTN